MKNSYKLVLIAVIAFGLGLGINNFAMSDIPSKIAVVDVQKVVASSNQVKILKSEQEKKMKDLASFVDFARKNVSKESDAEKKRTLEEKYNKELNTKKKAIDKEFSEKLLTIDKNISTIIAKEAKNKNYDLVLAKGVVLYGGEDITENISKLVK